jgi:hypothetical protein
MSITPARRFADDNQAQSPVNIVDGPCINSGELSKTEAISRPGDKNLPPVAVRPQGLECAS